MELQDVQFDMFLGPEPEEYYAQIVALQLTGSQQGSWLFERSTEEVAGYQRMLVEERRIENRGPVTGPHIGKLYGHMVSVVATIDGQVCGHLRALDETDAAPKSSMPIVRNIAQFLRERTEIGRDYTCMVLAQMAVSHSVRTGIEISPGRGSVPDVMLMLASYAYDRTDQLIATHIEQGDVMEQWAESLGMEPDEDLVTESQRVGEEVPYTLRLWVGRSALEASSVRAAQKPGAVSAAHRTLQEWENTNPELKRRLHY